MNLIEIIKEVWPGYRRITTSDSWGSFTSRELMKKAKDIKNKDDLNIKFYASDYETSSPDNTHYNLGFSFIGELKHSKWGSTKYKFRIKRENGPRGVIEGTNAFGISVSRSCGTARHNINYQIDIETDKGDKYEIRINDGKLGTFYKNKSRIVGYSRFTRFTKRFNKANNLTGSIQEEIIADIKAKIPGVFEMLAYSKIVPYQI